MIGKVAACSTALALVLTGCGAGAPSEKALAARLKSDTQLASMLGPLSPDSTLPDYAYTCMARGLIDDVQPGDLDDYVHGKKELTQVAVKPGVSETVVSYDFGKCLKTARSSVSGGSAPS